MFHYSLKLLRHLKICQQCQLLNFDNDGVRHDWNDKMVTDISLEVQL